MNGYKVKISSCGNGWNDERTVGGTVNETDGGVIISYNLDGDECSLFIKDGKAVQTRRGTQFVQISFEEGRRTECIIGSGEMSGSFEVFTRSVKFINGKGGYKLFLKYTSGSDKEQIELNLIALKENK